uniref:Uncharacterized protein n=1 Tax=Avena sativa TaxID=4498 RepID=A0ACD5VGL1_AVESA
MEEVEDVAAVRKRKRDGEVASVSVGGAGVVSGEGGCFSWKELELEEKEGEEYEGIEEESVEEVMRWLEMEISSSEKGGGDGFVTINGNEESCGPSFSAAASTVMASVDTRAGAPPPPTPIPWPWPEPDDQATAAAPEAAADEFDEEWLLDLLSAAGPPLDVFSLD